MVGGAIRIGDEREERILGAIVEDRRLVGIGVPDRRAVHERLERGARERVVEPAGPSVEHEAVGVGPAESGEQVDEARRGERRERIFVRIRVQVSHDQRGRAARACGIGGEPRGERLRRAGARPVAVALAVAQVGIAGAVARRSLRLPVIHRDRYALPGGQVAEAAREARPIAARVETQTRARVEHRGRPERCDAVAAVEQADRDLLLAQPVLSRIDHLDRRGDPLGERSSQLARSAAGCDAVVLELGEREHVGVDGAERREDLGALALELDRARGAAGREPAAGAVAVEEVLDVPGRDAQRAVLRARRFGPRGGGREADRKRGMQAKAPEREVDHALDLEDAIPEPQSAALHRFEIWRGIGPARVTAVVEQHAVAQVALVPGARGIAGLGALRGLPESLPRSEHDFAEAAQLFRAAGHERLRDPHAHALDALPGRGVLERQAYLGRARAAARRTALQPPDAAELGESEELAYRTAQAHRVAGLNDFGEIGGEDEQPLGAQRARIRVAVLLLYEQPTEAVREAAEVGDDDPLDDHARAAREWARRAGALDRVDRRRRRTAFVRGRGGARRADHGGRESGQQIRDGDEKRSSRAQGPTSGGRVMPAVFGTSSVRWGERVARVRRPLRS